MATFAASFSSGPEGGDSANSSDVSDWSDEEGDEYLARVLAGDEYLQGEGGGYMYRPSPRTMHLSRASEMLVVEKFIETVPLSSKIFRGPYPVVAKVAVRVDTHRLRRT